MKQEVERRKKIAKEKGLDDLFSTVFHDSVQSYPEWIKNERNKRHVHPDITKATEKRGGKEHGPDTPDGVEFVMGDKLYLITKEEGFGFTHDDRYCDLVLYLNGQKVFAISESIQSDEWTTTYSPISIGAYIGEDWVSDFQKIKEYKAYIDKVVELEFAEDPKKTDELKKAFGITELPKQGMAAQGLIPSQEKSDTNIVGQTLKPTSIWSKWWVWAIIAFFVLALLDG